MTSMTPLEQALAAWTRHAPDEMARRQMQIDDATALGQCGVFSNRNISMITGLSQEAVAKLTGKTSKTGGRLAPESLPFLLDAANHWARYAQVDAHNLKVAIDLGTSWGMMSALTGIPRSSAHKKVRESNGG